MFSTIWRWWLANWSHHQLKYFQGLVAFNARWITNYIYRRVALRQYSATGKKNDPETWVRTTNENKLEFNFNNDCYFHFVPVPVRYILHLKKLAGTYREVTTITGEKNNKNKKRSNFSTLLHRFQFFNFHSSTFASDW